jgi:hypothetical protein
LVDPDNTVRFGHHLIDIPANRTRVSYARARVETHPRFDETPTSTSTACAWFQSPSPTIP